MSDEINEVEEIVGLFDDAQGKLLETLNNKTIQETTYASKSLLDWDIYFTVRISIHGSMEDMRHLMILTSNKLDECRNLLSGISGKYKNAKYKLSTMKSKLMNIRLEYNARGTATNLKRVERELSEEYLSMEMANSFMEIIMERFQANLYKLIDKKKAIEVILYNMQNELRNM